eukprot:SAG11_NODE_3507_length_2406_cov_1.843520_3_plen_65_part_00
MHDHHCLQFVRDLEVLNWAKAIIAARERRQIYKQVTIMDMKGFGMKHMGGEFAYTRQRTDERTT